MVKKIAEYINKYHMLKDGDTVIIGVSGGADSVCLLSVLCELRQTRKLSLIAAHVNHLYRETADRDENYVKKLCMDLGVEYKCLRMNVQAVAAEKGLSFEEAGRFVRYDFFMKLKEEYGADKIAVAHHLEDCSETVLFQLFRGSNTKGLGGITPTKGDVIRPLLNISRNEIEQYLLERNIEWMEDETNDSLEFSRNAIRHCILPLAEKVCSGASAKIAETAEELRAVEEYLAMQTQCIYDDKCEIKDGGIFIRVSDLQELHPVLQSRILYLMLEKQAGTAKDLGRIHVKELEGLCNLQSGRSLDFPYKVRGYRTCDGILVRRESASSPSTVKSSEKSLLYSENDYRVQDYACDTVVPMGRELEAGEEMFFDVPNLGMVRIKLHFDVKMENIPQKTYTKWFDYDKISRCPVFRKRREGDYLTIDEAGNHKKLKEYLIQEKIPSYKRDELWILADEAHVMWVPGHRISAYYKISEKTERVLEVTIGGKENG